MSVKSSFSSRRLPVAALAALALACLAPRAQAQIEPANKPPELERYNTARTVDSTTRYALSAPNPTPAAALATRRFMFVPPPVNEPIVGLVDAHFLTKRKLDERVDRLMFLVDRNIDAGRVRWKEGEEDKTKRALRTQLEQEVLYDWGRMKLLAAEATNQGFHVTPADMTRVENEINASRELDDNGRVVRTTQSAIMALGIPREELLEYIHDAALAEKLINSTLARNVTEQDRRMIYSMYPRKFYEEPAVRLNYMRMTLTGEESVAQRRELNDKMEEARKQAAKRGKFLEVARDFNNPMIGQFGGEFGWATVRSLPQPEKTISRSDGARSVGILRTEDDQSIARAVFGLKEGEVSKVLACELGFYVFQLVEFKPPDGVNYDQARPAVDNALYDECKAQLLSTLPLTHLVYLSASGLNIEEIMAEQSMTEEERAAKRDADYDRKLREFREKQSQRLAAEDGAAYGLSEDLPAAAANDPWQISAKSLDILKNAAQEDRTRLQAPGAGE